MTDKPRCFELHVDINDEGLSAIDVLADKTAFSKQKIKKVMQKGAVWLTHAKHTRRLRRASKTLAKGDQLHCYYDEAVLDKIPPEAKLIADEGEYSIWYKPYGMLSQGSKWGDHTTIYRYAEQHLQPQRAAFIVHRLDRAATGLMLLAHKKKMAAAFADMFKRHALDKCYRVVVHGKFPGTEQLINDKVDGKPAVSHVHLVSYREDKNYSLLEVKIETGRKHQIRKHLSGLGFPVVGDRLYGAENDAEDLQLTACYLAFISPLDNEKKEYRLPDDLLPNIS